MIFQSHTENSYYMKTQAAVLTKLKAPLEIWELEIPPLKPGQVLVEIAYSGLCHTQLNEIKGFKGEDCFIPHTLGHEGSGTVLEVGENVTKVRQGDRVVVSWLKGAGADVPSTQYRSSRGVVNSGAISTFMHKAIISENRVIPLPPEMPLKEAALLGCALPTGAGVVKHEMGLKAGDAFAVFGAGGIGLSALIAAKQAGANPLIAVDVQEDKLQMARRMGATHIVNASEKEPIAAIMEITGGKGVDYAFESAGKKEAMEKAFCSLKAPGLCVLAGNLPKGEQIAIDPFELIRGKRITGTWGGKSQIDTDVREYAHLYLQGKLDLSSLITHIAPLSDINRLFSELDAGRVGRALLNCLQDLS
jgi:S-(hydroxymethyl)glutathione dehydrogenase / alcohol dehydrogenase